MPESTYNDESITIEKGWLDALLAELQSLVGISAIERAAMRADLLSMAHKVSVRESIIQELTAQRTEPKEAETPQSTE